MRRYRVIVFLWVLANSLNVVLAQVDEGLPDSLLIVHDIHIAGNKVTRENIILKELVFSKGDTIPKMKLVSYFNRSRENLLNLSIFNFVSLDVEHLPGNRVDVIIHVTERWYIWPTPIFEHADRNFSSFLHDREWSKLNYGLWLKWNNFRGRNEILSAKIRLGYKEQYQLEYEKPNLGRDENHRISFGYSLSRQRKVNYLTLDNRPEFFRNYPDYALIGGDGYLAYTYRPGLYTTHRFRLHYVSERISDTVALLNPAYLGDGRTLLNYFQFDYIFNYDIRDSKVYPLEGEAFKVKIQRLGLGLIKDYPYNNWMAEGSVFLHRKLSNRIYLASVTKGKYSLNKELPLTQLHALGYNEYMTSYEYFVIDGTDFFISKLITKFEIIKPTTFSIPYIKAKQFNKVHFAMYINLLGDLGYVNNKYPTPTNYMQNELQYSTGIGIDLVTYYDKVLRIEYSVNRYGQTGLFFHLETPFFRW